MGDFVRCASFFFSFVEFSRERIGGFISLLDLLDLLNLATSSGTAFVQFIRLSMSLLSAYTSEEL